jgi:hypothetical protein
MMSGELGSAWKEAVLSWYLHKKTDETTQILGQEVGYQPLRYDHVIDKIHVIETRDKLKVQR